MIQALNLRRINDALFGIIILLNLYVVAAPFVPALIFWGQSHDGARQRQLSQAVHPPTSTRSASTSQGNHLVVPAMLLDEPIYEGSIANTYATLSNGIWRWPMSSTPDKGGNVVLIGHRFTYTNPRGAFYELDKVKFGDEIGLSWSGKEYVYKVSSVSVVPPTDTAILRPTKQPELTLYTCTPLWWPKNRLVVVAGLEKTL